MPPQLLNTMFKKFAPALDVEVRLALQPNRWNCFALGPADRIESET